MSIEVGTVGTFEETKNNKAQALKPLEEAAEVFGKWQTMKTECGWDCRQCPHWCINHSLLIDECADVIQATVNLLDAIGVSEFKLAMNECRTRNEERGREYAG